MNFFTISSLLAPVVGFKPSILQSRVMCSTTMLLGYSQFPHKSILNFYLPVLMNSFSFFWWHWWDSNPISQLRVTCFTRFLPGQNHKGVLYFLSPCAHELFHHFLSFDDINGIQTLYPTITSNLCFITVLWQNLKCVLYFLSPCALELFHHFLSSDDINGIQTLSHNYESHVLPVCYRGKIKKVFPIFYLLVLMNFSPLSLFWWH